MNNFLVTIREGLSRVRKVWIITAMVVLGLVLGVAGFASGAIGKAIAAVSGKTPVASVNQRLVTPTMAAMVGMETPTAMPDMSGMALPTAAPGNTLPPTGSDMDALLMQMGSMTQSLQGMMGQLDQKSANMIAVPTAIPAASVDMQAMMTEMQAINQVMGPLMLRIQADLQGNPSAEELASVRAQVEQINARIGNLLTQLQAAPGTTAPGMAVAPTMPAMPGMVQQDPSQAMMTRLDQMMQQMQMTLQQMQAGSMAGQPGSMPGINMALTPMPGMASIPPAGPMVGMSGSSPSMDDMMMKMDNMMTMMDSMMGTGSMASQPGSINMAAPTAMPGMSGTDPAMGMMDDMMMMMDDMMIMMDSMMGMPDM